MKNRLKAIGAKLKEKKGSLLWELLIVLMILFAFLYSAMTFLGAFVQYESLSYAAKSVARQIEVSGSYDPSNIMSDIEALTGNSNLRMGTDEWGGWYKFELGPYPAGTSASLRNSLVAQNKIQLRQTFTITLYATYDLHILGSRNNSILDSWTIPIPMKYTVTGMSEVFWRS